MSIVLIIQIIQSALQLAPFAVQTVQGIQSLLAQDPSVPAGLRNIIEQTLQANGDVLAEIARWRFENPQVEG
jgi:hypothetical protein